MVRISVIRRYVWVAAPMLTTAAHLLPGLDEEMEGFRAFFGAILNFLDDLDFHQARLQVVLI